MNKRRIKLAALISGILLLLVVGACGLWLHVQQRQYARNRQLIEALVHNDDRQAIALVNEGADPNTRLKPTPVPSPPDLLRQLFHRSQPPVNDSPTAFMIACGERVSTDQSGTVRSHGSDDAPLVQAMWKHGAKVNAKDKDGWTALMIDVIAHHPKTVGVLLQYRADANVKDKDGWTPLMYAIEYYDTPDVMRLLLEHGADVNAKDENGIPPLLLEVALNSTPDVVRLLLEHGADANAKDDDGRTPLMCAQGHPDIIALLKHAGAKK